MAEQITLEDIERMAEYAKTADPRLNDPYTLVAHPSTTNPNWTLGELYEAMEANRIGTLILQSKIA